MIIGVDYQFLPAYLESRLFIFGGFAFFLGLLAVTIIARFMKWKD